MLNSSDPYFLQEKVQSKYEEPRLSPIFVIASLNSEMGVLEAGA